MKLVSDIGVDPLGLVNFDAMALQSVVAFIRYFQQVDSTSLVR